MKAHYLQKTMYISDLNSIGVAGAARAAGCEYVTLVGVYDHPDHPNDNDWRISVYEFGGIRVASTNGDPVWEEDDYTVFANLLKEYGAEA